MDDKFEILGSEDGDVVIDLNGHILKLSQLDLALSNLILDNGNLHQLNSRLDSIKSRRLPAIENSEDWINKGVECQVLKPGKNWQSGKFRIKLSIEFCPDESEIKEAESPLDDLRRQIDDISS
ncbi:MAG: hypothetical protein F6K62_05640 [Sphaerospermopsis sp. SIO1G2]|nr:hypothetical protein [Sphaerospermopsis sp. SIO1G2]